jgi:hypothetical protein
MKLEDLGIDSKTMVHNPQLTTAENRFLGLLWIDHVGAENKISADDLAILYYHAMEGDPASPGGYAEAGRIEPADLPGFIEIMQRSKEGRATLDEWKRDIRYLQSHLLMKHENLPVISRAGYGGGYWIAESKAEIELFFNAFRKRGMHGIVKASRASKVRFAHIMQQLTFEFEELVDKTGGPASSAEAGYAGASEASPAPYVVVDALLEKMMGNPEQFSSELQRLGQKFGSVLLPKKRYEEIRTHTRRLQELVAAMGE